MRDIFFITHRLYFSHWKYEDIDLANSFWGEPEVSKFIFANDLFTKQQFRTDCVIRFRLKSSFMFSTGRFLSGKQAVLWLLWISDFIGRFYKYIDRFRNFIGRFCRSISHFEKFIGLSCPNTQERVSCYACTLIIMLMFDGSFTQTPSVRSDMEKPLARTWAIASARFS